LYEETKGDYKVQENYTIKKVERALGKCRDA